MALLWYFVVGISVVAYVALDGFDLGVGILNFFTKEDRERRIFLNAIGPVWDGNEVWLVIVGGALFAGFPDVYSTLFSGFYNLCMLLLAALIFRAVSIEFRSKRESHRWRRTWDALFSAASLVIAFALGLVFGNLIEGLPLDNEKNLIVSSAFFFKPFSILIGLFTVSLMTLHGSLFLSMKTEGALHTKLRRWTKYCVAVFVGLYLLTTVVAWKQSPHMIEKFKETPLLFIIPALAFLSALHIYRCFKKGWDGWAFLSSCFTIFLLFCVFGIGTFPYLVRSSVYPEFNSLTFYNAASSELTLTALLIIVAIGVPLVLAYGFFVYRIFKGKVRLEKSSY
jgi:cytochrome d ubiquinol oxidase subunit II